MQNLSEHESDVNESEINYLLEQQDPYIRKLASQTLHYSHQSAEDLAQLSRIKFWQAAKTRQIMNPQAYIRCIVKNTSVEMLRQQKPAAPLPLSDDGELLQGKLMLDPDEEMRDPLEVIESKERFRERLDTLLKAAASFPPRQKRALICRLKDRFDDLSLLVEAFKERDVDIESQHWPADEIDRHNLAASIAPVKRKMKELLRDC